MAKTVLKTAAAATPITLAEVKTHLRWDDANDNASFDSDAHLTTLISRALDIAESDTWSRFYTQTWTEYFDTFEEPLILSVQPVQSISSITYTDGNSVTQTLSSSVYELGKIDGAGVVRCKYGQVLPVALPHPDSVVVEYIVGYGVAAAIPEAIKHALLLIVTSLAAHRGDDDVPLPRAAKEMLSQYTYRKIR